MTQDWSLISDVVCLSQSWCWCCCRFRVFINYIFLIFMGSFLAGCLVVCFQRYLWMKNEHFKNNFSDLASKSASIHPSHISRKNEFGRICTKRQHELRRRWWSVCPDVGIKSSPNFPKSCPKSNLSSFT